MTEDRKRKMETWEVGPESRRLSVADTDGGYFWKKPSLAEPWVSIFLPATWWEDSSSIQTDE